MKKLEIIIRPEKLEDLKETLNKVGVKGMMVSTVMGCGNQKGIKEMYRGTELTINLLHKLKVEIIVADGMVETIIKKVRDTVNTGNVGDGKIFIYNVENAVRIRTGETGESAI
ncbi:MAG: nitrogen regulatory protein 1 [Petroclostridium sp.]|jgi:nitrogen regulatory protein P-II 1|uniref:P-II family nitrogen regulator n=1 Tax=Petroclostridium xylanilyticum TaxID=1792311 RepID=UPI000B98F9BD|nr:P-II family nitrogen regulator [Petroclostridium xylanilyticum]MBZ4644941.1 nitrogen regulatory protein [Clostridia bacterium]MDK2810122.1 nitrogen regulatory protein 1 [Petroclostridium sp.]